MTTCLVPSGQSLCRKLASRNARASNMQRMKSTLGQKDMLLSSPVEALTTLLQAAGCQQLQGFFARPSQQLTLRLLEA